MALVPYLGGSLIPFVNSQVVPYITGTVARGIKRKVFETAGDFINRSFSKRKKTSSSEEPVMRKPRGGTWSKRYSSKKISRRRRRIFKRRFKKSRKASATTTSRYRPYASYTPRNRRTRTHNIANIIEKASALASPTSKILLQQNTEITSAGNACGWDEFFACTSYGCTGFLGQCLPRQYGAHMSNYYKSQIDACTKPMFIKSVHMNFCIRDNISGTSHLKLYTVKCIKSHKAADFGGKWPDMLTKGLSTDYHHTFTSTALTSDMVAFSPFALPGFGRFWRVIKEEDFYIESAQSIDVNKSLCINRWFTGQDLAQYDFFKNSSYMFLFKIVGDTDTTTPWNLTAGGASVCVNKTVYSKWDYGSENGDRVYDGYGGTVPS